MAFNPPVSGWTAMSLAPNPELFGNAHATIDNVSSEYSPLKPVSASPIPQQTSSSGYQALRNAIMPTASGMPTPQQQQQLTQPSPLQAVANVSEQLKNSPWTPKPAAQPNNFVNNQTGETQAKPAMPQSKFVSTSGWTASLPKSSLPTV